MQTGYKYALLMGYACVVQFDADGQHKPEDIDRIRAARIAGVHYPPALLFLVSILVLLTIVMHQSMQISVLEQKMRDIARAVALLGHGAVYPYYEQTHSVPRIQEVPNDRHVDS